MSLKNCIIVLWIYIMYFFGTWIFLSGYLLKRIVVHKNGTQILNVCSSVQCQDYASLKSINELFSVPTGSRASKKLDRSGLQRYKKAILLVVDALRYDFTVYDKLESSDIYYLNKMPVFSEISERFPQRCLLLKLIADPPTTTLQRLTGLTTGSLPTFIDISLSFASTAIQEDNIIWQLNNMKRNIIFLGDDTWEGLFPNQFHRSFSFPSFNVKDLHTVDSGILDNIYQEIEKDDWDIIIAHFLGVDHCGHRYGPNHPAMANKLQQMNNMIRNVIEKVKEDTILFVLGDHGMTETGDHGGDSYNETMTALFLYSPSLFITEKHINAQKLSMLQIDLVPTLSMLLGFPIPFSNLGSALPHVFTMHNFGSGKVCFQEEVDSLLAAVLAYAENAYQVHQYLMEYANISQDLSSSVINRAESLLQNTFTIWNTINGRNRTETIFQLHRLLNYYEKYLKFVQSECSKKWAKFNIITMACGIIILCVTVLINLVFAYSITISSVVKLHVVIISTVSVLYVLYILYFQSVYIFTLFWLAVLYLFFVYSRSYIRSIYQSLYKIVTFSNCAKILLFCCSFSNSFIVYEDQVILFLLQTFVIYKFLPNLAYNILLYFMLGVEKSKKTKVLSRKSNNRMNWIFLFCFLCLLTFIRLSCLFHKCREEQLPCETSQFLTPLENLAVTSTHKAVRLGLSWMSVLIPAVVLVLTANYMHPVKNYTAAMICINYGVIFSVICICLHWWLSLVSPEVLDRILGKNQVIAAQSALVTCIFISISTWIFPLLPEKPVEYPMNQIFTGSFLLLAHSILLPLYLTSGDGLAISITLMVMSLAIILILNSLSAVSPGSNQDIDIVIWGLSSYHWFYRTGHQPTFPALQWGAAFIVSKEVISYALSGTFVVMNTFSSQILHGITLPMLIICLKPAKRPGVPLFFLVLKYLSFLSFKLLGSVISCFILRRHLMVWKIFTPKLIFEAVGFFVTSFSTLLSYLFIIRVTSYFHKQIKKNDGQVWFSKDE